MGLGRDLVLDVCERGGEVYGEYDEDDVRFWVGERPETVVLLLAGGVPEGELDVLALVLYDGHVVLEYGRDICLRAVNWPGWTWMVGSTPRGSGSRRRR